MKAAILTLSLALLIALPGARADSKQGYKVYLTNKEENGVPLDKPAEQFSCNDKIYGVLEINRPGAGDGNHTLYATWRNPAGEDQEHTKYPFQLIGGSARLWVWLKLHRSTEAAVVQFLNPSAGMDEFIGKWEIQLYIDGKLISKRQFDVLC